MNDEPKQSLRDRTRLFALRVIRAYVALPKSELARILGRQLVRSGTSVGAHCREGYRARSDAEIISKLEGALQELDETLYWLELIVESELVTGRRLQPLMQEANEIIAIIVTSVKTIKSRRR
jgi:four helix bundle protein